MTERAQGERPLAGMRFSLVGNGRVGHSLAAWAAAAGARQMAAAGREQLDEMASGGQDLLLIAVPDVALDEVAARLGRRRQAAVALHTSGSRDAGALAPLAGGGGGGSAIGTLHPLKAFPFPLPDPAQAQGVFFALDGDAAAMQLAARMVEAWGGVAGAVPPAARALYHFAATLAAGGVASLLAAAADLAARAGLPAAVAAGYVELARGTVEVIGTAGSAAAALTGPVARGDLATFERHLAAIRRADPERIPLAVEIARETLRALAAGGREAAGIPATPAPGIPAPGGPLPSNAAYFEAQAEIGSEPIARPPHGAVAGTAGCGGRPVLSPGHEQLRARLEQLAGQAAIRQARAAGDAEGGAIVTEASPPPPAGDTRAGDPAGGEAAAKRGRGRSEI